PPQAAFRPGEEVSVRGETLTETGITRVIEAKIRRLGAQAPPKPVEIARAEDAAHGDFIAVEGRVRDVFQGRNRARLVLALEGGRAALPGGRAGSGRADAGDAPAL